MTATNISVEIRRDTALEQRMLEAVVADRNAQPRSQQLQVGPSQVGGCRELLRAGLFEPATTAEPETTWATAAHGGQVMGDSLETIFGERLDALTQQRITARFGMLGVEIAGAVDLLFLGDGQISDLKSSDDIGGVLYDLKRNASIIETLLSIRQEGLLYQKNIETPNGGYELTEVLVSKLAKLHYYVQVAIYVVGAIQQGILEPDAEGRLVFYDRSGGYQGFVALVITNDEVALFYDIAQLRLQQVVDAQMAYEATGGNPAVIAPLRDMAPSYCFSPKVMCPRRMHCWAGSDWAQDNRITSPEHVAATNRYIVGRDLEKLGKGMKASARAELEGVSGMLPDGKMVTWGGNGSINVVETTVAAPQTQARLDEYVPAVDVVAQVAAEHERTASGENDEAVVARAFRQKELEKLQKGELLDLVENLTGERPAGVKAKLITIILDEEARLSEGGVALGDHLAQPMDALDDGVTDPPQSVENAVENNALPRVESADGRLVSEGSGEPGAGTLILPEGVTHNPGYEPDQAGPGFAEMVESQESTADAAHVAALRELAAQGGPAGDEAADQLQESDPWHHGMSEEAIARAHANAVAAGMYPAEPAPEWTDEGDLTAQNGPEFADPEPPTEQPVVRTQQSVARTKDGEVRTTGVHFEDSEILKRRQALFGMTHEELTNLGRERGLNPEVPRNFLIQGILDVEFQPVVGRGWKPNGAGTSGDPVTDRLRDMQYNADPAMRRNYEGGQQ